jgi:hypothetical protein
MLPLAEQWAEGEHRSAPIWDDITRARAALAPDTAKPSLAADGCGQIGPKGLRCTAHVSRQHISYVFKAVASDEVADRWPLAPDTEKEGT